MNKEQLDAIYYLGNTLLIAGAGTGKTTTIINKVNYLLDNKIYKDNEILVISFTNESVLDIKKKIKRNVDVKTFHKLALSIIDDKNYKVCPNNYLDYIIREYLNINISYTASLKRLYYEKSKDELISLIKCFINLYKANYSDISYLYSIYRKSHFIYKDYLKVIIDIYLIYSNELVASGLLDFNDMINYATNLINSRIHKSKYRFIIIDEAQDTSLIRLNLVLAIMKQNNGKIFAVGDDYQSIYRFSGTNINVFLNINKYISDINIMKLKVNYRNNSELIRVADSFIMRNKRQFKKESICLKSCNKPIKIIFYVNKDEVINKLINIIEGKILLLGRNNRDNPNIDNDRCKFLTIHKSKGLEEDNVIIVNLEDSKLGFPSKSRDDQLLSLVTSKDYYLYEEERRLFYVALTRSKNCVYLPVYKQNMSIFVKELIKYHNKYIDFAKV